MEIYGRGGGGGFGRPLSQGHSKPFGSLSLSVTPGTTVYSSSPNSFATDFVSVSAHHAKLRLGTLSLDHFKRIAYKMINFIFNPEYANTFFSFTRKESEVFVMIDAKLYNLLEIPDEQKDQWEIYSRIPVYHSSDNETTELINKLTAPLAAAGVSVMNLNTVNTDYLMVKEEKTTETMGILREHLTHLKKEAPTPPLSSTLTQSIQIELLPEKVTVISVNKDLIANWAYAVIQAAFFFQSDKLKFLHFTRTEDEITLIADDEVLEDFPRDASIVMMSQYRLLMIHQEEGSTQYGVLNAICTPLAQEKIAVLNITTLTRNYLLVDTNNLEDAKDALSAHFRIIGEDS